jgi:hypothetical protein
MNKQNRIVFAGNPWPKGHVVDEFSWEVEKRGKDIWFQFHLETVAYNDEGAGTEAGDDDDDWKAPIVWNNYHRCKMSTSEWHNGGFRACAAADFTAAKLNGLKINVDAADTELPGENTDDRAFHIYLLGHDAVADHVIALRRVGSSKRFDITWRGKIAKLYSVFHVH